MIGRRIAADEFRHYKMFYSHLKRYLAVERIGPIRRFLVAASRVRESEDDELAYAYFAANESVDAVYDRKRYMQAYARRAYPLYRRSHVQRAIAQCLAQIIFQQAAGAQGVIHFRLKEGHAAPPAVF